MPLPPFDRQMGAGKTSLQPISLNSCNWVRQLPHRGLQEAGFHTGNCFALIMTTHEGKTKLAGWTQDRWDRAVTANHKSKGH